MRKEPPSIIEQAARRIEQLRQTGIDVSAAAKAVAGHVVESPASSAASTAWPDALLTLQEQSQSVREGLRQEPEPSKRSRDVEIQLDLLARQGYLVPAQERGQIEEEFRIIKRPLLKNAALEGANRLERANLIMVTSALPGEGKTFTSINLAISLAMELDHTVLLVDADVVRPAVLPRLGLPNSRGLLDVLANPDMDLSEVMLKTNIDKLSLLPAGVGSGAANTTELLASSAMETLLSDLAEKYADRIIVFDAPPLIPSTESRVLATKMGQVVVVVEADRTPSTTISQAFATLESCPVVLSVLNKSNVVRQKMAYGYYAS
jgi:protein-tyrosine kinase